MSEAHAHTTDVETQSVRTESVHATDTTLMKRLFAGVTAVAFIGWLDTTLLTGLHLAVLPLPPGVDVAGTGWAVLISPWSYLLGIPTAMYGAAFYLLVITLGMAWLVGRIPHIERILLPVTTIGILASASFVYLQLFVIEAICPFCMISAGTTTILFLLALGIFRTSDAPGLSEMGLAGLDRQQLLWPAMLLLVGLSFLAMLHLVTVLPLPIPGS